MADNCPTCGGKIKIVSVDASGAAKIATDDSPVAKKFNWTPLINQIKPLIIVAISSIAAYYGVAASTKSNENAVKIDSVMEATDSLHNTVKQSAAGGRGHVALDGK